MAIISHDKLAPALSKEEMESKKLEFVKIHETYYIVWSAWRSGMIYDDKLYGVHAFNNPDFIIIVWMEMSWTIGWIYRP